MGTRLKLFYVELLEWLNKGKPYNEVFTRDRGLCVLLATWAQHKGWNEEPLTDELCRQFIDAGMDTKYPFNKTGLSYREESWRYGTMDNIQRIAWIKKHGQSNACA